ncbi:MAG: 2-amino-4-hydroxy-6-hydroxymethyldihydropteridine diphosphokinase [Polyangiales bacterium]
MTTAVVGLGSNLGSREQLLRAALALLDDAGDVRVEAVSSVRETAPVGPPQPHFLNAAARVETRCDPGALLSHLLEVERRLGRIRRRRWGPRTIDLDLLWMDAPPVDRDELTVPHPRLTERQFALAPLLEVAPELRGRYGDALERLGGMPLGAPLERRPPTQPDDAQDGFGEHLEARDAADAIAGVVSGLAVRLADRGDATAADPPPHLDVRPVHGRLGETAASDDERLRSFAQVVLERMADGFGPHLAVIESVGAHGVAGRVLGRPLGRAGPRLEPARARLERGQGGRCAAWLRVAPEGPSRPNGC